jgi:hypothetical protein
MSRQRRKGLDPVAIVDRVEHGRSLPLPHPWRTLAEAANQAGAMKGRGEMRRRSADRDPDTPGWVVRAWRWLRSSGYYEDDQAGSGSAGERQAKERFGRAVGAQISFWKVNRPG